MKNRPEIDGLRAIAVMPVILFHGNISLFQGGFVGVDIFFVISGYLISRIIFSEIFQSSFSIINFYERRARRILPALFAVLIFTTFFAWHLLPPIEFKDYGQSLFSVSLFASNIFFWLESGYFDLGINFKPLIHTWSLGVEEQFYIFFPLIILLIFAIHKKFIFPVILILFFLSLYLSHSYSAPERDLFSREAAFFLLPSRAWELLLGSILFLTYNNNFIISNKWLNNALSFAGIALIVYSILFFNEHTPFPSAFSLIPTLGAALVIIFSIKGTIAYKLLTLRPMIIIGLISYSAYLWHQPLLSLSRYYFVSELNPLNILMIIMLTFILAYLSWRFVEQPFRDIKKISRKSIFLFSASGCLLFAVIGTTIHLNDGFINRYNQDQIKLLNFHKYDQRDELYRNRICFLRGDQDEGSYRDICKSGPILIWGDSHAASLSYGMTKLGNVSQLTSSGCPPMLNLEIMGRPHCSSINQYISEYIAETKPRSVLLSANWINYQTQKSDNSLATTLDTISKQHPSVNFFILGGLPQWIPSLPSTMLRANLLLDGEATYIENQLFSKVKSRDNSINAIVLELNAENLLFVSLLDLLCKSSQCLSQVKYPKIEPITFDYGHLTGSGSIKIASLIFNSVNLEQSRD